MDILELPLPRAVERSDCLSRVRGLLSARVRRLWSGGDLEIPVLVFTRPLQDALRSVRSRGNLRRGLESVEDRLEAERIGLLKVSRGAEREPRERISRLILLSNDGSDRFYRKAEKILIRYAPRVLAVILDADSHTLGRFLFGADSSVKLMMVDHKDSVALVLLSLAGEGVQ